MGHCHPKVVAALAKQAGTLNVHTRYLHETIIEYGEKLTSKFHDSLSMLFFTCTGSEAHEVALRMARTHTGKKGIICSNATYHGNTTAVNELATVFNNGKSTSTNVKPSIFHAPIALWVDCQERHWLMPMPARLKKELKRLELQVLVLPAC